MPLQAIKPAWNLRNRRLQMPENAVSRAYFTTFLRFSREIGAFSFSVFFPPRFSCIMRLLAAPAGISPEDPAGDRRRAA